MYTVRPVRLALTASSILAGIVVVAQPWSTPAPIQKVAPVQVDAIVASADPSLPTVSNARVSVVRDPLERATPAVDVTDIPALALVAYQRAATVADRVDRSCGLSWTLLAAVGGVESDHGRFGGSSLGADGVSDPLIRGLALNGRGAVAEVADTDAGRVDGDRRWDRAVGPMQFLPSTWATLGVDADGDGVRSADDIDDAALGAAVFLCSAPGSLSTPAGMKAALHRYNPSAAYVAEVMALEQEYRTGQYDQPDPGIVVRAIGPLPTATSTPDAQEPAKQPHHQPTGHHSSGHHGQAFEPDHPSTDPSDDPSDDPTDEPTDQPTDDPTDDPTDEPSTGPETQTLTGTLADCGTDAAPAWCLDDQALDFGDADYLAATALGDFDADGAVETNAEEVAGLAGTELTVEASVTTGDVLPVVLAIGDLDDLVAYVVVEEPDDGSGPPR